MPHYELLENNALSANRTRLDFTQEHLAKLLSLGPTAIGNYERGYRKPNLDIALGMELLFGQSLADLYPGLARSIAERMIPVLQKLSIAVEWDDRPNDTLKSAVLAISDRLSSLIPDA